MRISDSKIDEIRSASDIVDIISSYSPLKKRGKNFIGLCPFHQEKTPSFTISAEKQMYHCFGCGKGGNVFTFIMELEKVSFVEAVRTLAERAGILLPREGAQDSAQQTENELLYDACRRIAKHFYDNLVSTVEGKLALEYFHHRGFTDETIRKFGLGYSLNSWNDVVELGQRDGIGATILERAGLLVKRDDGSGWYDRFRGRAMFPIFSPTGRVIGFGARKLREEDTIAGKYINSPETPIYEKSRVLYGLFQAKDAIREKEFAILVEGYADLISLFQSGIQNVVASSGTALADEQVRLIGRYTKSITLVYDADSAGSKATMRGVDIIIENDLDVKIAELPQGEDPDSFVRKQGRKAFEDLLDHAVSFLDFKAAHFRAAGLLNTPEGQTRAVRSIVETIARMKDELKRNFYIKHLSQQYGMYESVLFRELERQLGTRGKSISRKSPVEVQEQREAVTKSAVTPIPAAERDLLTLMLEHGNEMVSFVLERLSPEMLTNATSGKIFGLIGEQAREGKEWTPDLLLNRVDDEETKRTITEMMFSKDEISSGWAEMDSLPDEVDPKIIAERCLAILRGQQLDQLIRENQQRLNEASAKGEPLKEYLEKHQRLMKEKHLTNPSLSLPLPRGG